MLETSQWLAWLPCVMAFFSTSVMNENRTNRVHCIIRRLFGIVTLNHVWYGIFGHFHDCHFYILVDIPQVRVPARLSYILCILLLITQVVLISVHCKCMCTYIVCIHCVHSIQAPNRQHIPWLLIPVGTLVASWVSHYDMWSIQHATYIQYIHCLSSSSYICQCSECYVYLA